MNVHKCYNEFCGAYFKNLIHFYPSCIIFVEQKDCISGKIRGMKLCSADAHGFDPSRLCNEMKWNVIVWILEGKQDDYFLVYKVFSFYFDLMIHRAL